MMSSTRAGLQPPLELSSLALTKATASGDGGASRKILRSTAASSAPSDQRGAKRAEPAAERAHHPADMLADDEVADADLAKVPSMSSMKVSVSSTESSR